ncbi:uncharacterized protein [Primulina huaijiensis]|uniref:uncharacterized protein n=1 Tax=Primulina huaijiensis TaxID=1492673 RepID=UPI003CC72B3E
MQCPSHAFRYNGTLCACDPGYLYNFSGNSCHLFVDDRGAAIHVSSGVSYDFSVPFPGTIFSFDSIKKFTQSQAVFLEATLVMLLSWLAFCLLLRFVPRGSDGRSLWFKIRWWVSRLDISFATRHWLDDQKPVRKRKTELGGTFSIAGWILFIGLFAALLYQIISKRSVEVHNVRATNEPDLASFMNDLEFNITTISSMSCAQLRGLGTLVAGSPSLVDYRVLPLSTFANFSCLNTTAGPTITLQCNNCMFIRDLAYVSWQFVDLPNNPATAVGYQFNLTAKNQASRKHLSFVSGILRNGSNLDNKPIAFRGAVPNILKFNLFPRIYHNLHDLRLIQPLFHGFLPGSYYVEPSQLQASLENSSNGLINTTLSINFLSSYIIEIDNQNILGPVSFLADLGGLYCISIGIFYYFLVQFEYRIKRLRNEDSVMRRIRDRRKAQERWDKLRKYVRYTWTSRSLNNYGSDTVETSCAGIMMKPFHRIGSSRVRKLSSRADTVKFSNKTSLPSEKKSVPEHLGTVDVKSCSSEAKLNIEARSSFSEEDPEGLPPRNLEPRKDGPSFCSHIGCICQERIFPFTSVADLPAIRPFEVRSPDEINILELQKNLQNLYEYNVLLRDKLIAACSMVDVLAKKEPPSTVQCHE